MNTKKSNYPKIKRWIVKYDNVYQMPQFIQGQLIGNTKNIGKNVMIKNIESIDLENNVVTTYNGSKYSLVGKGKRMILIGEDEMLEITMNEMNEFNER